MKKSAIFMNNKSFTLLELVIVIVILGILATLGYNQYSLMVEKSRTAEAIALIGVMRINAQEYYLKNGSLAGIQPLDVSEGIPCSPSTYFQSAFGTDNNLFVTLAAYRCTSGGKAPDAPRAYSLALMYYPSTGVGIWSCQYIDDSSPCGWLVP